MSNMKIISTGAADILLVYDLLTGTSILDCEIVTNQSIIPYGKQLCVPDGNYKSFPNFKYIDLPECYNYTVLNRVTELTEQQCHELVPSYIETDYPDYGSPHHYMFYDNGEDTAKSSFKVFLESQGIFLENPYTGFECPNQWCENGYIDQGYNEKWRCFYCQENEDLEDEAQSKVKNPLVIKADKIT